MSIPRWRYVRYTDDGSALYQCLNCYKSIDTRCAPGYFNEWKEIDEPVEGCLSYIRTENGVSREVHSIKLDDPPYIEDWKFCPFCGVRFEGAVRCNADNEYMYGPKRLSVWNKIQARREAEGWAQKEHTGLWWIIQRRYWWKSDKPIEKEWETVQYAKVGWLPAVDALTLLNEQRVEAEGDTDKHMQYEARLVTSYHKPKQGYEIQHYHRQRPIACVTVTSC